MKEQINRSIQIIVDELAVAAVEQGMDPDTVADMVRDACMDIDIIESGETE